MHEQYLQVFRLRKEANLPRRALSKSVGFDVEAFLLTESGRPSTKIIPPQCTISISTGVVVLPPAGFSILVCSRSGMAAAGLIVANAPGVIDPDYTGELKVLLCNTSWESRHVKHQDRVAQLLIIPCPIPSPVLEINALPQSERGPRGFGSTGA